MSTCGEDGAYKIIENEDLRKGLAPRFKVDDEMVSQMVKFLAAGDLIDIKYSDDKVHCIAILPKGRIFEEEKARQIESRTLGKGIAFLIITGSFFAAIIGAVIGGVIVALF